jgi:hypothetical protein
MPILILILMSRSRYLRAGALVAGWRPGVEGGNALWSLLVGQESFSGRLAQAWPHSAGAAHLGGISPWFEKQCSEECPGLTMNNGMPHGLSLDPTGPAFPFGVSDVHPPTLVLHFWLSPVLHSPDWQACFSLCV